MEDFETMSVKELKALCKERGLSGYSSKNKPDLIAMLQEEHEEHEDTESQEDTGVVYNPKGVDNYTEAVLKEQYLLHKNYVQGRKDSSKRLGIKFRLPSIPEDISENIIKFILHRSGDKTSSWNCSGDLLSKQEGKQECKCFTSNGPPSFTPSSEWDVIYFLDAREWLNDKFILYKISLKRSSEPWKNMKVNGSQTFEDQCKQGRRPRIVWKSLHPQVEQYCQKIFEGSFEDIFTAPQAMGSGDQQSA